MARSSRAMTGRGTAPRSRAGQASRGRRAPVDMAPESFRTLGHALVDRIAEFLGELRDRPVTPGESPSQVRRVLGAGRRLPARGEPAARILADASEKLFGHSLFNGHPRFFGYITSSPAPLGMLGDLLAAAVNANAGGWTLAPMATEIEAQTVRWIGELIGYRSQGGLLVSGGNVANFVGFWAARASRAGWDARRLGLAAPAATRLRVYASAETHTWIQKAADLSGLGTDAIRFVPTDARLRMRVSALVERIEEDRARGDQPFLVVGTAGSVSTGAVDPLPRLARVCRRFGLWFHVDGAYGGFAAAVPEAPADLRGLAHADSVAVDPHKWLYAPLEAGCVLVRDADALQRAFSYHPPYYQFDEEATNYFDHGPQNSRGQRALKVWLQLRQAGRAGYVRMLRDDMRLARAMHRHAARHPECEALTCELSIATFRFVPLDLRQRTGSPEVEAYLDTLNRELLEVLCRGGEAFLSNAVIAGRFALRACVVNFRTTSADAAALPEIVARAGRALDAVARPPELHAERRARRRTRRDA